MLTKPITDLSKAYQLTEERNHFAKGRKSLPIKLTAPKPILMQ